MEFLGLPLWLFALMMALSLLLGIGIRYWLDRREKRRTIEEKAKAKERKKQNKRARQRAQKAAKRQKGKPKPEDKEPQDESAA